MKQKRGKRDKSGEDDPCPVCGGIKKTKFREDVNFILPMPGESAEADITCYMVVRFDYQTRKKYGFIVPASEVSTGTT